MRAEQAPVELGKRPRFAYELCLKMAYLQVAIGVIVRDGRVLVTRRVREDQFRGMWEFPGGKLEPDEGAQACLHRELGEELGVGVTVLARLAPLSHDYGELKVTLHPFVVGITSGEPEARQSSELRWATPGEMQAMEFPAASVPLVSQLEFILASVREMR